MRADRNEYENLSILDEGVPPTLQEPSTPDVLSDRVILEDEPDAFHVVHIEVAFPDIRAKDVADQVYETLVLIEVDTAQ